MHAGVCVCVYFQLVCYLLSKRFDHYELLTTMNSLLCHSVWGAPKMLSTALPDLTVVCVFSDEHFYRLETNIFDYAFSTVASFSLIQRMSSEVICVGIFAGVHRIGLAFVGTAHLISWACGPLGFCKQNSQDTDRAGEGCPATWLLVLCSFFVLLLLTLWAFVLIRHYKVWPG